MTAQPDPTAFLRHRHRWRAWEVLPWLIAMAAPFLLPDYQAFGAQVLITIIFAISIDLIVGYTGIVSLGHAAFFGLGAYAAGMVSAHLGWREPVSAVVLAGAVAALFGWLSGRIVLRYHGLTLLMLTLASAIFLKELANANDDWTGGFDGLLGIEFAPLLGIFEYDLYGRTHYFFALLMLVGVFWFARRMVNSPFGQSLIGIRENAFRMSALGTPVFERQVRIYTISAGIAGIAGGLFAVSNAFVTLDVLDFSRSGTILIMIILGGTGHLYGAFIGAALYMVLEDELARLSPEFWEFGVGLLLVIVVMFGRGGVIGLIKRLARSRQTSPDEVHG